jgi:phosphate-selective porin
VVPIENAFCRQDGCWNFGRGAWEVLARYNYLNMDSKGVNGGVLNGIVLGVNWYLNPKCRFMVDYAMDHRGATQYVAPGVPSNVSTSPSGWLYGVGARFHVDF